MAVSPDAATADATKKRDAEIAAQQKADADNAAAVTERAASAAAHAAATAAAAALVPAPPAGSDAPTGPQAAQAAEIDVRVKAAAMETARQELAAAAQRKADDLPDPRISEPEKGAPDDVVALLGDGAKATGALRVASVEGVGKRLQAEWARGNKAAWFDVPTVTVGPPT